MCLNMILPHLFGGLGAPALVEVFVSRLPTNTVSKLFFLLPVILCIAATYFGWVVPGLVSGLLDMSLSKDKFCKLFLKISHFVKPWLMDVKKACKCFSESRLLAAVLYNRVKVMENINFCFPFRTAHPPFSTPLKNSIPVLVNTYFCGRWRLVG